MTKKVIVGLSGGVDSSVAALLLSEQGYDVEALFMKSWDENDETGRCLWESDVEDALFVCEKLKISLNTADLSKEYWHNVFKLFLKEYSEGRTPNPDILCNQEIKFRAFLEHAVSLNADLIATGHYVINVKQSGKNYLHKSRDLNKDQSYFLCRLTQAQLGRSLFPLGELNKLNVRSIAKKAGFITHDKKDSTGICFIGERSFRDFLSQYIPIHRGPILTTTGETIGEHEGAHLYTLGQRRGLGIGGVKGYRQAPWYVVNKDLNENTLIVTQGHDHPSLLSGALIATHVNWIADIPEFPCRCSVKTRYRQVDQDCIIDYVDNDKISAKFARAQRAVTPGQYAVFYDGPVCLGGGVIESTFQEVN